MTYIYNGYRLQTSGSQLKGWICFINEEDPLFRISRFDHQALAKAVKEVDKRVTLALRLRPTDAELEERERLESEA